MVEQALDEDSKLNADLRSYLELVHRLHDEDVVDAVRMAERIIEGQLA